MTRENAILCLKGIKNYDRDTFTEQSDWQDSLEMAIKALEQEPFINKPCVSSGVCEHDNQKVLDKIRAEIAELDNRVCQQFLIEDMDKEVHHTYRECIDIIDKYKAKSEDKK